MYYHSTLGRSFCHATDVEHLKQRSWMEDSNVVWLFPYQNPEILTCIYASMHIHMHTCMRACVIYIYKHTCMHTYIHTYMHTYIHAYIHTCLLLLISMLWHKQAIFELKGDKLSSSAECGIRAQRVTGIESPADWMPADKLTELSRIKLKI